MNPQDPFQTPAPQPVVPPQPSAQFNAAPQPAATTAPTAVPPAPFTPQAAAPVSVPAAPAPAPPAQKYSFSTGPGEFAVDYLNQIAPKEQKRVNRIAIMGLAGGAIIAVIAAAVMLIGSGGPDLRTQAQTLQARINTLQTVADGQQPHLKENAISEANATLSSTLTSINADLAKIMADKKIKSSDGQGNDIKATEKTYATALTKKLDDGYQRGTVDRTYTSQMTYELTILRSKLRNFKSSANSTSVDKFSDGAISNVDAILKSYASFAATK